MATSMNEIVIICIIDLSNGSTENVQIKKISVDPHLEIRSCEEKIFRLLWMHYGSSKWIFFLKMNIIVLKVGKRTKETNIVCKDIYVYTR